MSDTAVVDNCAPSIDLDLNILFDAVKKAYQAKEDGPREDVDTATNVLGNMLVKKRHRPDQDGKDGKRVVEQIMFDPELVSEFRRLPNFQELRQHVKDADQLRIAADTNLRNIDRQFAEARHQVEHHPLSDAIRSLLAASGDQSLLELIKHRERMFQTYLDAIDQHIRARDAYMVAQCNLRGSAANHLAKKLKR